MPRDRETARPQDVTEGTFPKVAGCVVFGMLLLAIAGVLALLALPSLPLNGGSGVTEIRLPGKYGDGLSLGKVPAVPHLVVLAAFAVSVLVYLVLSIATKNRHPVALLAIPVLATLACGGALTVLVATGSPGNGLAITLAIVSALLNTALVGLVGGLFTSRTKPDGPLPRPGRASDYRHLASSRQNRVEDDTAATATDP